MKNETRYKSGAYSTIPYTKVKLFKNCMCLYSASGWLAAHHLIGQAPSACRMKIKSIHILWDDEGTVTKSDDRKIHSHTHYTHSHTTQIANIEKSESALRSNKSSSVFEALWSTTLKAAGHFAAPATLTRESSALFSMCFFCSWGCAGQTRVLCSHHLPLYYINGYTLCYPQNVIVPLLPVPEWSRFNQSAQLVHLIFLLYFLIKRFGLGSYFHCCS